jgi:hypothetical protein
LRAGHGFRSGGSVAAITASWVAAWPLSVLYRACAAPYHCRRCGLPRRWAFCCWHALLCSRALRLRQPCRCCATPQCWARTWPHQAAVASVALAPSLDPSLLPRKPGVCCCRLIGPLAWAQRRCVPPCSRVPLADVCVLALPGHSCRVSRAKRPLSRQR